MRWQFRGRAWRFEACDPVRLMGVLNVTPDSFSDGGQYLTAAAALEQALALVEAGADIIDVGGESSRPGAEPVPVELELERVVPLVRALRVRSDVVVSVDTTKAAVARAALEQGADIVNDITALTGDPLMTPLVAETGAGVVLMHMRGRPATMQQGDLSAEDLVGDVVDGLQACAEAAVRAGVAPEAICLDPGLGFGKTVDQNLALVAELPRLCALGRPVLVGASRKSFLGAVTGQPVDARSAATAATNACAVWQGASILRVHDAAAARDVSAMVRAISERAT